MIKVFLCKDIDKYLRNNIDFCWLFDICRQLVRVYICFHVSWVRNMHLPTFLILTKTQQNEKKNLRYENLYTDIKNKVSVDFKEKKFIYTMEYTFF